LLTHKKHDDDDDDDDDDNDDLGAAYDVLSVTALIGLVTLTSDLLTCK